MPTNTFQPVIEIFQYMKSWKLKVEDISGENILGHPQGENFEFKMMV